MTNNPAKYGASTGTDFRSSDASAWPRRRTPHNVRYLRTKRERMGHQDADGAEAIV